MTTQFHTHPAALQHVTPTGHPERVERLEAIYAALRADAFAALDRRTAPEADAEEVLRCHTPAYLDLIRKASPGTGWAKLDPDTFMAPNSFEAALRAVGAAEAAVDAVLSGAAANAFVAMRPPGHHAERARAMGFCLFGTVAIAAKYALDHHGLSRVAVLDFDVHHGNGTQDLLWDEPRAMFVSSHQMPLYPGSGAADETGAHGQIVNLPLGPGSGGHEMRVAWEAALPRVAAFRPELILVSAGFDAHRDDPLAGLNWTEADFAWITHAICDLAEETCAGRVVSSLEGGYDLDALGASVAQHVKVLMERGA
ncbi:histone deacetylase family protein [Defluviimonas sp. D31]|uniref:histone deacetylase family protein n=1 Tax=Defluviimonas sp. D31 TaxID=3083253 RepID=UPI00296E3424|nr:histone deacetylase family protein [Defluviimonas sp. D31]MDW4549020.1 histone deacetylase family protein [Defluviimonas sp. D31]